MKARIYALLVLLLIAPLSGCLGGEATKKEGTAAGISKAGVTEAPTVTAATTPEELESQFPDITATTEEEITIVEPDLEAEETVDLGSIL